MRDPTFAQETIGVALRNGRMEFPVRLGRSHIAGTDLRVGGNAVELPAGPLRVALGAEYAFRDLSTLQEVKASDELYEVLRRTIGGIVIGLESPSLARMSDDRGHRIGGVAEAVVPLVQGKKQRVPLQSVELNLASRAARTDGGKPAWSSLASLKVAPSSTWAVRGTVSQGYVTPERALIDSPIVTTTTTIGARSAARADSRGSNRDSRYVGFAGRISPQ